MLQRCLCLTGKTINSKSLMQLNQEPSLLSTAAGTLQGRG